MKVSIAVEPDVEHTTQVIKGKGMFAKDQTVAGPDRIAGYFLTVKIVFSEEEKSIISTYHLHDVVLFDKPTMSPEGIQEDTVEYAKNFKWHERRDHPEWIAEHQQLLKQMRTDYHVGDFADYHRRFDTAYETYSHIDYLKARIFPVIKDLVASFGQREPVEEFEL